MKQLNKLATAVGVALTLGYGAGASAAISAPGALADAMLRLNDFTILAGTGNTTKGAALPLNFSIILDGNLNPVLDPTIPLVAGAGARRSTGTPPIEERRFSNSR